MTGLDQESNVGVHERHGHGHVGTIWEHKVGVLAEHLDEGEDVVPTSAVQSGAVVTEFIDDLSPVSQDSTTPNQISYLVHLESSIDGLDQASRTDGTTGDANVILGQVESIVPEAGLEIVLHLGEVEVRAKASGNQLLGVVEEIETKVEQAARDGLSVNGEVLLLEVPASGTGNDGGERLVGAQLVFLSTLREVDLATNGIVQVDLAVDHVLPGGSGRI